MRLETYSGESRHVRVRAIAGTAWRQGNASGLPAIKPKPDRHHQDSPFDRLRSRSHDELQRVPPTEKPA